MIPELRQQHLRLRLSAMTDPTQASPAPLARCLKCESNQIAHYWASRGQKAGSLYTTTRAVALEALDNLLSFDSRVWRSLITWFRHTGSRTVHYWKGHRGRFVALLRLYLFVSFVTFLFVATVAPDFGFQGRGGAPDVVRDAVAREKIDPDAKLYHYRRALRVTMTAGVGVDTMPGTGPNVSSLAFLAAAVRG